eukprot:CAMPEP_0118989890 /NCGR_PEP_ID=MMETSP1173-20130426/48826_1 /TAXON_ID=1034831 /ORGANISM="Rhizochromulina marina cf, Strain CCMP1243" /LENGTH=72 /DNA_ID=CAMNT_0006940903 /DNA_START=18 /DNA_END=233 /DNA_ORIENTATION=+
MAVDHVQATVVSFSRAALLLCSDEGESGPADVADSYLAANEPSAAALDLPSTPPAYAPLPPSLDWQSILLLF